MRFRFIIFTSAIAMLVSAGCVDRQAQQRGRETEKIVSNPTKPVRVATVTTRPMSETLEVTGQVATSAEVAVGVKSPGRIVSVYVRDGDTVRTGQLIAAQDTSNQLTALRQAQAQVGSARAALTQARANAAIAPARSTAAVRSAEAQLRSARAQLQKARAGARVEERAQAEANVASARSNMETAKREMDRQRDLFAAGAVSRQQVERAENAYQNALAQYQGAIQAERLANNATRPEDITAAEEAVRQAEEGVRSAKATKELDVLLNSQVEAAQASLQSAQAQVTLAQQALEDAQIRAPFPGRISGQPVQPGTVLGSGGTVATIVGGQGAYFEADVPEGAIGRIRMGSTVSVRIQALGERSLTGRVASISPTASSVGRLFRLRIQLADAQGLRPGMFASGTINLRQLPSATVVPSAAIIRRPDESFLFVVEDNKAKRVDVRVGLSQGGWTQVNGVSEGQVVVVNGQQTLVEGSALKIENETGQGATPASTPPNT